MGPFTFFAALDDSGIAENLHMVGKGRLTDVQFFQQLARTLFTAMQHFQNPDTVFITQGFEDTNDILFVRHEKTPHIDVCRYDSKQIDRCQCILQQM